MSGSEAKLANVYEDEYKAIQSLGWNIQQRWREEARSINISNTKETARKCNEFSKWIEGEFEKIGFVALVDTTPIYADQPPVITLMDRVEDESEFDHEKKARQIKRNQR